MKKADRVFEHRFRTQQVMHTPLEPLVSVAESTDSSLTIHTASQSPSFVRIEIARLLGWPENRVRVRVPFLGGGFGAKLYIKLEALVSVLVFDYPQTRKDLADAWKSSSSPSPSTRARFRIKSGVDERRAHRRARLRGVVERRRVRRHRAARDAEVRLHRAGSL